MPTVQFPRFLIVVPLLLAGCAGQLPPPGGPPDTQPPAIIRTVPDTNAIRVATHFIELEFDEYVDRRSVEESIFISPYLGELEYDWSGREIRITFSESLKPGRTYVVNVGTDIIDIRARNRMMKGFTLAFSTGDSIDRGAIRGRVFGTKPEGVMVYAYGLQGIRPDTLDPARVRPDFITQTGDGGYYSLSNLSLGPYRVFAVRDEYKNLLYDRQIDGIGVASGDIVLAPSRQEVDGVNFLLRQEDTTRIFVTTAVAVNRRLVDVRFSEPPDSLQFSHAQFSCVDTANGREVGFAGTFLRRSPLSTAGLITLSPLDSGKTYRLTTRGLRDRSGNGLDTSNAQVLFEGSSRPDTLAVSVTVPGLRDSSRGVWPRGDYDIIFSEPVGRVRASAGISLRDSSGRAVPLSFSWLDSISVSIVPRRPLDGDAWYTLRVRLDSLLTLRGWTRQDSVITLRFSTLDMRTTGTIDGDLADQEPQRATMGYSVVAKSTGRAAAKESSVRLARPGPFAVKELVEGNYEVFAFERRDSTMEYRFGSPFPYVPAARFTVYQDTVKVRARWAVEGVMLRLDR